MPDQYMRNPETFIAGNSNGAVLICPDGSSLYVRKQTNLMFKLVELLREPRSLQAIQEELQANPGTVEQLIAVLEKRGIILHDAPEKLAGVVPRRPRVTTPLCQSIVVGICGAVQATALIPLLVMLQRLFTKELDIVLTGAAGNFIRPEALSYFGFRVWNNVFQSGEDINVPHIHLANQADLVLVLPATAHAIHRIATGACSDLLSLVVSATRAPVVVVPTMNSAMLQFGPIRRNIEQLRSDGIYVVEPGLGCEVSKGHDDTFSFAGIGLTEANVVRALTALVTAHRELAVRKPPLDEASDKARVREQVSAHAAQPDHLQEQPAKAAIRH